MNVFFYNIIHSSKHPLVLWFLRLLLSLIVASKHEADSRTTSKIRYLLISVREHKTDQKLRFMKLKRAIEKGLITFFLSLIKSNIDQIPPTPSLLQTPARQTLVAVSWLQRTLSKQVHNCNIISESTLKTVFSPMLTTFLLKPDQPNEVLLRLFKQCTHDPTPSIVARVAHVLSIYLLHFLTHTFFSLSSSLFVFFLQKSPQKQSPHSILLTVMYFMLGLVNFPNDQSQRQTLTIKLYYRSLVTSISHSPFLSSS